MDARLELITVVEDVRRRWRTKLALRGALIVLAGAVLTLVLASSGLQAFAFAPSAVIGFRIAVFAAFAALIGVWLFRPLRRKVTDEQVALYIEEQDPTLREELVSAIEMSSATNVAATQPSVSVALVDRLVRDAIAKVRAIDNGKTIGREVVRRLAMALGAGLVATTLLLIYGPEFLRDGVSALLIITRDAEAAAPFHIGVEPGNARVPRGSDQTIKAKLSGFASNDVQLFFRDDDAKEYDSIPLAAAPTGDAYMGILFDLKKPVTYYVKSNGVTSSTYTMTLVDLPAVDEMEVEYVFPAYTGLPNQVVKPGGDVAALRGTEVRLKIKPTMATPGGAVAVDPSGASVLTTQGDGTLTGGFKIDNDGFYHVELTGPGGEKIKASPEYTVDALTDANPRVSFSKPGRDTHAMSLDEVFLQVKADDDYGVRALQLFYSVNGGAEKSVNLYSPTAKPLSEVTAGHTIYLEELGVKPGDSVSYYAKATDSDIVSGPKVGTSDIYFVEIDPFNRNFRQAQSQQQMQGQGQQQQQRGSLAAQEKEIIAATFNTERDRATMGPEKFKEALVVIRLQQDKLRGQVDVLVAQMLERLQGNQDFKKIADLLVKSIEPMKAAETHLDAQKAKEALAPEQKAYQLLQEAEQQYDLTVGRQQQQGGGGGGGGQPNAMSEDLADLFQTQLDKQANQYETEQRAQGAQQAQADQTVDALAEKLKELARRQQQEVERQRRAQQQGNRATQGGQGQRQLADEMEQMARQLQQLSREQQREQAQRDDLNKAAQQMHQAANQMRQAAANGQSDGGAQGQNALQQMQEAARQLQQAQQSRPQRDLNAAQQQADKLVQEQKDVAGKAAELSQAGQDKPQKAQRLADDKAKMTQGVNDLQSTLDKLATDTRAADRDTSRRVQDAASALRDQRVKDKIDYTRGTLQNQQQTTQQFEDEIAKNLADVQRRIGDARTAQGKSAQQTGLQQAAGQASDLLRNMQSMRDRMKSAGEQGQPGEQGAQVPGKQGQDGKQGQGKQGQGDGKQGQQADEKGQDGKGGQNPNSQLSNNPTQRGGGGGDSRATRFGGGVARQFANEAQQAAQDATNLRRALADAGASKEDQTALEQVLANLRQLGQPNAYNDPAATQELAARAMDKLQTLEFNLRKKVEKSNQLFLNGSDQVPPAFRGSVEEYYRSLAKKGGGTTPPLVIKK